MDSKEIKPKFIVSSRALLETLKKIWGTDNSVDEVMVPDETRVTFEVTGNVLRIHHENLTVHATPNNFSFEVTQKQINKLKRLLLLLEDQPIIFSYNTNSWIGLDSIVI